MSRKPELYAAASVTNITPEIPCPLAGYSGRSQLADEIADDLFAKALVLSDGSTSVAMMTCDLIGIPRELCADVRREVHAVTGIPREHIIITASHTHFGPAVRYPVVYLDPRLDGTPDPRYDAMLVDRLSRTFCAAHETLRPARVAWGTGIASTLAYNRRTLTSGGQCVMSWLYPERPDEFRFGPTDAEVGLLRVDDESGCPIGLLVNYACHPVCNGNKDYAVSADFPGVAMALLEEALNCPCLFLLGAAGDIVPRVRYGRARQTIGQGLAEASFAALGSLESTLPLLATARRTVRLPLRPLPSEDEARREIDSCSLFIEAFEQGDRPDDTGDARPGSLMEAGAVALREHSQQKDREAARDALYRARQNLAATRRFGSSSHYETELHVIRIGDVVILALPGEVLVEIGLSIKASSPFRKSLIATLANDRADYICHREAFAEGGYEPATSRFACGAGEIIRDAAVRLLRQLTET